MNTAKELIEVGELLKRVISLLDGARKEYQEDQGEIFRLKAELSRTLAELGRTFNYRELLLVKEKELGIARMIHESCGRKINDARCAADEVKEELEETKAELENAEIARKKWAEDNARLVKELSDANYWRERHIRESSQWAEQSQENWKRADAYSKELVREKELHKSALEVSEQRRLELESVLKRIEEFHEHMDKLDRLMNSEAHK
jgi:Na+-translocating ferredoxin:NAD+ oxidoreductase RnfC subunit